MFVGIVVVVGGDSGGRVGAVASAGIVFICFIGVVVLLGGGVGVNAVVFVVVVDDDDDGVVFVGGGARVGIFLLLLVKLAVACDGVVDNDDGGVVFGGVAVACDSGVSFSVSVSIVFRSFWWRCWCKMPFLVLLLLQWWSYHSVGMYVLMVPLIV